MAVSRLVETDVFRGKVLDAAKRYKASWIELGQYLYNVYRDKLYRNWDYLDFEIYCVKELHLKQSTAVKLLKSYSFLEQEKPELVRASSEGSLPKAVPNYESVNL